MQSILIFGRQPELGLAEIESIYGPENVQPIAPNSAVINVDPCNLDFKRLGGSSKLAKLLTELNLTDWNKIESYLIEQSPTHAESMPPGKMHLGISVYGFNVMPQEVTKTAIKIKKAITPSGRSVRVVPNKELTLNSASVIHNKLTKEHGWELLLIKSGDKTYIGQTVLEQDIKSYASRDQTRPKRDAKVGMLPPKLAQIIINLASPRIKINPEVTDICEPPELTYDQTVLDPFCGSGVILQEALLMGYNVIGCDVESKMVDYSRANLDWLKEKYRIDSKAKVTLNVADAKNAQWPKFDFVATETNLGKPLNQADSNDVKQISLDINALLETFLKNLAKQSAKNSKHCIAIPAWQISPDTFIHLPLIDRISELGYNLVEFKHLNSAKPLIYYRPNQVVARELLVIIRK